MPVRLSYTSRNIRFEPDLPMTSDQETSLNNLWSGKSPAKQSITYVSDIGLVCVCVCVCVCVIEREKERER